VGGGWNAHGQLLLVVLALFAMLKVDNMPVEQPDIFRSVMTRP
jgi:hypothetical protein